MINTKQSRVLRGQGNIHRTALGSELDANVVMADYKLEVMRWENVASSIAMEVGARLTYLLTPILHNWGMGMLRGGDLLYLDPNSKPPYMETVIQSMESDFALQVLHTSIAEALWTPVDIFPFESTFHSYIDDIPLPLEVTYYWLTELPTPTPTLKVDINIIPFQDPAGLSCGAPTYYYGPVTDGYIEGMSSHGDIDTFISTLPQYTLNSSGTFDRVWLGSCLGV
jgi:hypothetical protein